MSATHQAYTAAAATFARLHHLGHLQNLASWDQAAFMPPKSNEARAAAAAERHPLKRVGEAEDLAAAGLALLDNPWISGQVLGVDGGMSSLRP